MDEFSAKRQALLAAGVRMMDPSTVYVEESSPERDTCGSTPRRWGNSSRGGP